MVVGVEVVEAGGRFEQRLGVIDAVALVAGSMIGSGIFIVSADIARRLPAPGWLLLVWGLAGVVTVAGAVSHGGLAAAMPRTGGQYVYLTELYGPLWGFLFGWTLVLVTQTGTIAAVAVAFATFAGTLWPALSNATALLAVGPIALKPGTVVAIAVILTLTALNARGLEAGRRVQTSLTVLKVGTLLGVIGLGLTLGDGIGRAANLAAPAFATGMPLVTALPQLGPAMVGALFSSTAWATVTFAAAEVRDPVRTIPRALALGTTLVCVLYLATNVAYLNVLPLAGTAAGADALARGVQHATADRVGTAVMGVLAGGPSGAALMAIPVMIPTFGCLNGLVLAGARVAWAMANEGRLPRPLAQLNARHVPGVALWFQGLWASALALSGRYGDLLDYVVIAELVFYLVTVAGLFVLAHRTGRRPRGIAYPSLQLAYVAAVTILVVDLLVMKPTYTWGSLSVVATGLPIYYFLTPRTPVA